jgi:hypothetical protein
MTWAFTLLCSCPPSDPTRIQPFDEDRTCSLWVLRCADRSRDCQTLTGPDKIALARAQRFRDGQAQQNPPFDSSWCFFDLAEIKLYRGDGQGFLDTAMRGFEHTEHDWQGKTFVDSLRHIRQWLGCGN